MCKNIVEQDKSQMTIWRVLIACWIHVATNIPSKYVIRIAFPPQQWLHESPKCYVVKISLVLFCFRFQVRSKIFPSIHLSQARGLKDTFLANVLLDRRGTDTTNLTICLFHKRRFLKGTVYIIHIFFLTCYFGSASY